MKAGNRHGRQDHLLIVVLCASIALSAAPAQAMTGGASPVVPATPEGGIAFGAMRSAGATWYGPGLYGNNTACGQVLLPETIGVAHRSLPCGTAVKFIHKGQELITRVIDRGPYTIGNAWDLTNGARLALDFEGVGRIRYALERGVVASSARSRG